MRYSWTCSFHSVERLWRRLRVAGGVEVRRVCRHLVVAHVTPTSVEQPTGRPDWAVDAVLVAAAQVVRSTAATYTVRPVAAGDVVVVSEAALSSSSVVPAPVGRRRPAAAVAVAVVGVMPLHSATITCKRAEVIMLLGPDADVLTRSCFKYVVEGEGAHGFFFFVMLSFRFSSIRTVVVLATKVPRVPVVVAGSSVEPSGGRSVPSRGPTFTHTPTMATVCFTSPAVLVVVVVGTSPRRAAAARPGGKK